jgi:hypothetical protein
MQLPKGVTHYVGRFVIVGGLLGLGIAIYHGHGLDVILLQSLVLTLSLLDHSSRSAHQVGRFSIVGDLLLLGLGIYHGHGLAVIAIHAITLGLSLLYHLSRSDNQSPLRDAGDNPSDNLPDAPTDAPP